MTTERFDLVLARADRVMRQIDEREGNRRPAALRERNRRMDGYGRAIVRATTAFLTVCLITVGIGVFIPLGMFGFLAAVGIAIAAFMLIFFYGAVETAMAPTVPVDAPNGEMVDRFDSYIFRARRALPAPAQAEIDHLSQSLTPLRQTLERVDQSNPDAQDARRLMSNHLPGLIDRYLHVPNSYRGNEDGEGVSVDQRLVDALAAGRQALGEISEKLARADVAAFETQGRFIQSRYKDETLD